MENIIKVFTLLLVMFLMSCASMLTNQRFDDWRPVCEKEIKGLNINGYRYLALRDGYMFVNTIVNPDDLIEDIKTAENYHNKMSSMDNVADTRKTISSYLSGPVTTEFKYEKEKKRSFMALCFTDNQYSVLISFNESSCRIIYNTEFEAVKNCLEASNKVVNDINLSAELAKSL